MSSAPSQQQPPLQTEQPSVPAANVNVKIIINNHVHRKVLTLDAMHVDLFERSIRKCVPHHMGDILIERYSDSAGRYTIVDPAIPSSYKQLYRAAKAKGKLRVRIIQVPQPGQANDQANDSNKNTTGTGTNTSTSNTNIHKPEIHPIPKAKPHSQTHTPIRKKSKATVRLPPPTRAQLEVISSHNVAAPSENDQSLLNSNQHTLNQQNQVSGHENTLNDHWHCNKCDMGDYDLCPTCFAEGKGCDDDGHWLIRRAVVDGVLVSGSTEVARVSKLASSKSENNINDKMSSLSFNKHEKKLREQSPTEIKHKDNPETQETKTTEDGEKSNDCPDWDYCSSCSSTISITHKGHRFVRLYEPMSTLVSQRPPAAQHYGVYCDGPLCVAKGHKNHISGVRYKCGFCHDLDFCDACEASPSNTHDKTHPLIMMKTPTSHLLVSSRRYDGNCRLMECMGDIVDEAGLDKNNLPSLSMATKPAVADVEPVKETPSATTMPAAAIIGGVRPAPLSVETLSPPMPSPIPPTEAKTASPPCTEAPSCSQWPSMALVEQTPDKTIYVPADYVFTMCWELKNNGETVWPAGSYIELNGGDQLFTPKMRKEMAQETSSRRVFRVTASDLYLKPVAPGESAKYEVSLCSPMEPGTYSSGWRLTMSGGHRVGELMMSEVRVEGPIPVPAMSKKADTEVKAEKTTVDHTMVFPTLETESPVATLTQHTDDISPATASATVTTHSEIGSLGDFEPNEEWVSSDAEFMTDEEYDILDGLEDECRSY
ncbi:hypothetical protein CFO_g3761 [Ceratocystis platani]|uniref:Nbr1 FW domain-containing protein n=1 Tax=Ceratocystis fimbriata f. sp. platani TaxID=88771 RepID=A0A0F8B273_CERFI|nr:hypothetical protein CFO_g3761 [Ceratocystis platani]